ncbi:hypothetical protein [Pseudonocardia acidicola]|uniref:Exo-alpha-sialidase n=1 Tax=Pseudonocardia acidicola TaxID=2724939 RepID=A0ABX1S609_9PSEU|nr:hypothetical protein [Pseudonocardia acidicola]NMH96217.1 hypothetical protein [Pseudonocardia acidicola]
MRLRALPALALGGLLVLTGCAGSDAPVPAPAPASAPGDDPGFGHVHDLDVNPADPRRVLATSADGLLESRDGGRTFAPAAAQPKRPLLLVDQAGPAGGGGTPTVAGAGADGTVWSPEGAEWVATGSLGAPPEAFAVAGADRYLAATAHGVRSSEDGGRTWTPLD